MTDLLNNFSVDAIKLNWQTITCAIILWFTTLYCGIWSINQQPFNRRERLFWTAQGLVQLSDGCPVLLEETQETKKVLRLLIRDGIGCWHLPGRGCREQAIRWMIRP